jgi:hypothetical protein
MMLAKRIGWVIGAEFLGLAFALWAIGIAGQAPGNPQGGKSVLKADERLVVVWSSGDREVALNMVFMYTLNAKSRGWWKDVTLIVWGPSARLLTVDPALQERVRKMKEAGVVLEACKACSDEYGVSDSLSELGIDVKYMGQPLTAYIKEGRHILTF